MSKKMKKLRRPISGRKLAGVCAGIAEYLGVDVVVTRAVFILLLIPGGFPGLLPYVLLWIVVPEKE
jgi:phage shock protein C